MEKLGRVNTRGYGALMNNIGVAYSDRGELDRAFETT